MTSNIQKHFLPVACSLLCWVTVFGAQLRAEEFSLNSLFSDYMVLQRNQPIRVFGTGTDNSEVVVKLAGKEGRSTVRDGTWEVQLPAMTASGPHTINIDGPQKLTLSDVMIGDVWVGSGQSNMGISFKGMPEDVKNPQIVGNPSLRVSTAKASPAKTRDTTPDTWAATDALGRVLPMSADVGTPKANRMVGIFYFNWHAAFGNKEVHDIAKILAANPVAPPWGPVQAPHYWCEPRFGYYRPDDPWVIRKHVQMLTDAGVDVLILDATNGFTYDAEREVLCVVLEQMKAEGHRVPQIAMFSYAQHDVVVKHLWETFYRPGKHRELWFQWKGKPLLLTPPDGLSEEVKAFFTIRTSWAWTRGQPWFGDGKDKWPWLDTAPQVPGWHDAPNKAECVPVGVSQHITNNIGRSFHGSRQPVPAECRSGEGLYFDEQWKHALPHDPEFIFITGWNEWVAQRFLSDGTMTFQGRVLPAGETFFVDLYDQEFSRDIEPMRGGFCDNYYWQAVANIRRYKGGRPVPEASPAKTIAIPGDFAQWADVKPTYLDDLHDTTHRDHDGVPGAGRYTNKSGRNDLDTMHVAHDATHLFFHVRTREPLTPATDTDWMVLLLDNDQNAKTGHCGYDFRINQARSTSDKTGIERWNGSGWEPAGEASMQVGTHELHLAAERTSLGMVSNKLLRFDFKWTDNVPANADGMDFLDHGDTAPNSRFNYRYLAIKPDKR